MNTKDTGHFAQIGASAQAAEAALGKVARDLSANEAAGLYARHNLAEKKYADLAAVPDAKSFLAPVLKVLSRSWDTDMGDFEIRRKTGARGALEHFAKRAVWSLMKFYTFRMFSQTKAYNLQVTTALSSMNRRLDRLETRLKNERP